ncbi:hypothetical protein ES707_12306 [subsurface metagenome]
MSILPWTAPDPLVPGTPVRGVYFQELQNNCAERRREANIGIPSWLNASAGEDIRLEHFEEIKRSLEDPFLLQFFSYASIRGILGRPWSGYPTNAKTQDKIIGYQIINDMRRVIDALSWALIVPDHDAHVNQQDPTRTGNVGFLQVLSFQQSPEDSRNFRTFIRSTEIKSPSKLFLYLYSTEFDETFTVGFYEVADSWDETTLTWANQPSLGAEITTKVFTPEDEATWIEIDVGGNNNLCIKAIPEDNTEASPHIGFFSAEASDYKPYFSRA